MEWHILKRIYVNMVHLYDKYSMAHNKYPQAKASSSLGWDVNPVSQRTAEGQPTII